MNSLSFMNEATKAVTHFLIKAQNRDGGWGAAQGRGSNTEATSFALMALSSLHQQSLAGVIDRGVHWLIHRQRPDGSWPLMDGMGESSWTTGLAVIALTPFGTYRSKALRGSEWLLLQEGKVTWISSLLYRWVPQKLPVQVNPDLQGWPWTPGTSSWVEPTAYALIALKKLKPYLSGTQVEERIRQGESMIYNRTCDTGGWNSGPCIILGDSVNPYPDITALALIALQEHRGNEINQRSLKSLQKLLRSVDSGLTLSWSILCLALYGEEVAQLRERLAGTFRRTGFLGETKAIALALLASGEGARFFRV